MFLPLIMIVVYHRPTRYELHLHGDGAQHLLQDQEHLTTTIRQIAELASLRVLSILVVDVGQRGSREKSPWEYGISTVGVLATSHIALHTWPVHKHWWFDIVAADYFDDRVVRAHLVDALHG